MSDAVPLARPANAQAPFDISAAVDQVRYTLRSVPGEDNHWVVEGMGYRAEFDETGVDYTVLRPQRGERVYKPTGLAMEEVGRVRIEAVAAADRQGIGAGFVADTSAPVVKGNEIAYARADGVKEVFQAGKAGLELQMVVPAPAADDVPAAAVEGEIPCATRVVTDMSARTGLDGSIEFLSDGQPEPALRYRLTVQDASGRRLELSPTATRRLTQDGYDIGASLPQGWLRHATYPVTTSLVIGGEIPISSDATPTWGYDIQDKPAVASDGTNFLVVWQDGRNYTTSYSEGGYDIYGARVSPSGEVLDQFGIAISRASYNQVEPDVAFDGINYTVVWMDARAGGTWEIYGTRVTPQGTVLDADGIRIQSSSGSSDENTFPTVAYGDGAYLVVWQTFSQVVGGPVLHGRRVSPAGIALDAQPIVIMASDWYYMRPDCASDGANWLVVAEGRNGLETEVVAARVSSSGSVLDSPELVIRLKSLLYYSDSSGNRPACLRKA